LPSLPIALVVSHNVNLGWNWCRKCYYKLHYNSSRG